MDGGSADHAGAVIRPRAITLTNIAARPSNTTPLTIPVTFRQLSTIPARERVLALSALSLKSGRNDLQ
jgi:hypothetical protein